MGGELITHLLIIGGFLIGSHRKNTVGLGAFSIKRFNLCCVNFDLTPRTKSHGRVNSVSRFSPRSTRGSSVKTKFTPQSYVTSRERLNVLM
jgi:hypothetical protein